MKKKFLVIAAHPDDEVLGCGGTIARLVEEGNEVNILIVSRGIPEIFPIEEIEQTRRELAKAHKILGVSSAYFLDFPAPKLDTIPLHKLADGISKIIRSIEPSTVYLPHHGDLHLDHQVVYQAGLVATRPTNGCCVKHLFCYETPSETEWGSPSSHNAFVPTVFVDISQYLKCKIEAMSCYQSQLKKPPHARSLQAIETLACWRGATVSLKAAEAFYTVREVI